MTSLGLGWVVRRESLTVTLMSLTLTRGFSLSLAHPRARMRNGVLYSGILVLSARDLGVPRPAGSLTARALGNSGLALPRVSTCLSPLLVLRQSSPGTARLVSHRLVSTEPRALPATRPLGHSPVFPHSDVRRVYLVDSFIARDPQSNAHTTSLILTLSGHTFSG